MASNLVFDSSPVASHSPYPLDQSQSQSLFPPALGMVGGCGALTSALNSTNSNPLQSNSRIFFILGGSLRSYTAGAALMLAECSRCFEQTSALPPSTRPNFHFHIHQPQPQLHSETNQKRVGGGGVLTLQFLHFHTKFASPLLPLTSFCSNRLTDTQFGCVSRHEVHCTLNV